MFSQSVQNKRVAPFVDNSVNCTARGEKCSASLNNVACILMVLFRTLLCCWKESIEYVIKKNYYELIILLSTTSLHHSIIQIGKLYHVGSSLVVKFIYFFF